MEEQLTFPGVEYELYDDNTVGLTINETYTSTFMIINNERYLEREYYFAYGDADCYLLVHLLLNDFPALKSIILNHIRKNTSG